MAVLVPTANPDALLAAIKSKIDNKLTQGCIRAWTYETLPGGQDRFTIIDPRDHMDHAAWFIPHLDRTRLVFQLQPPERRHSVPRIVYATYHRLLLQMLLQHCYHLVSHPTATPEPTPGESPITRQPAHLAFR